MQQKTSLAHPFFQSYAQWGQITFRLSIILIRTFQIQRRQKRLGRVHDSPSGFLLQEQKRGQKYTIHLIYCYFPNQNLQCLQLQLTFVVSSLLGQNHINFVQTIDIFKIILFQNVIVIINSYPTLKVYQRRAKFNSFILLSYQSV